MAGCPQTGGVALPHAGMDSEGTNSWLCDSFLPAVSPMGNGTSRLYSALAKTINSSAAAQHPEYLVSADPEHLEPIDPKELLEECRAVLHTRPPRYQRDFVDLRTDCSSSHPPIRVMQWNILAQGMAEQLSLQQLPFPGPPV